LDKFYCGKLNFVFSTRAFNFSTKVVKLFLVFQTNKNQKPRKTIRKKKENCLKKEANLKTNKQAFLI